MLRADVAAMRPRVGAPLVSRDWGRSGPVATIAHVANLAAAAARAGADVAFGHS